MTVRGKTLNVMIIIAQTENAVNIELWWMLL